MGLMLEALRQIEEGAATPLGRGGGWGAGDEGNEGVRTTTEEPPVQRSSFRIEIPSLAPHPPSLAPRPSSLAPPVVWPECHDANTASAWAKLADGISGQLSGVVAFSSPGDGDGKTSLLLGLAPQAAQRVAGGVLVVDANVRHPDLTTRLGLSGGETAAPSSAARPTNLPSLSVLPASTFERFSPPCSPCPTADKPAMETDSWIDELRKGWPLVLLDTPSLAHAGTARLVRRCDGVYFVVRLGHTGRRALAEAARVLRASGGRLLGCVVIK